MQSFDAERLTQIKEEQENFYKKLGRDKKGVFNKESTIEICFQRAGDAYRVNISNIEDMHNQLRELYRFEFCLFQSIHLFPDHLSLNT